MLQTNPPKGFETDYTLEYYLKSRNIGWLNLADLTFDQMWFNEQEKSQYRLEKGDIVVSEGGEIGKSSIWNGIIKDCYIQNSVHRLTSFQCNSIFLLYWLFTLGKNSFFKSIVNTISISHLTKEKLENIPLLFPPMVEQERIAAYLDEKCGEIDELIDVEQQMISDLESYRQAVITEAVTHGINPIDTTKPTAIPWVSSIPEQWKEIRLKFLSRISTGDKDTIMANDEGEYPFFVRSPKIERINTYSYDGEAILMAGDGVGAGRVFHHFIGKFDWHQRVYNMHELTYNIYGRFLFYFLLTNFHKLIDAGSAKSTVDSVRLPMLTNFITLVPPLSEQKEISNYLDTKCAEIDELIKVKQEKIETLKQYRQSLIFEAVTGKITIA